MVQELNNEQLKAMLDDTQASLAAALARIEGFRLREKQLMNELSQLRQQVHGGTPPPAPAVDEPASAQGQATPEPAEASTEQPQQQQQQQEPWTSPVGAPVYLSYLDGEYPVHVLASGRKIPGSLVVTKEHLDFVEVKARIRSEEFIGITTHRMSAAPKASGEADGTSTSGQDGQGTGAWQILWRKGDVPQRLVFEASKGTRENLHRHTERWLGTVASEPNGPTGGAQEGESELAVPRNLVVGDLSMSLVGEPSQILAPEHVRALASVLPPMERMREWTNTYSTARHGISLATMYRKVLPHSPSLLVIKDFGGHVFGSYTPESWRVAPRFYGSGETFVFQLEPYKVMYPWRASSKTKNDFFQYGTPECIAVGGGGHFAIWVDGELLHGSSGTCSTFGSPCLATKEDFTVHSVEIWQVATGSTGGGH